MLIHHSGAGIIGQPYAFRNAGLVTGTLLLVGLTVTVDWTIRLIVINSKLSGTDSFQATVEHCFGKSGLVAISLAQWLLYVFGRRIEAMLTSEALLAEWLRFVSSWAIPSHECWTPCFPLYPTCHFCGCSPIAEPSSSS